MPFEKGPKASYKSIRKKEKGYHTLRVSTFSPLLVCSFKASDYPLFSFGLEFPHHTNALLIFYSGL